MRIGINGFGRIGRTLARVLWQRGRHSVVHVNDLHSDAQNFAYLLRNDSNYGRFPVRVAASEHRLSVEGEGRGWDIRLSSAADTRLASWAASGAEVVIEATGTDANQTACRDYLGDGVGWAIITHTSPHADATVVLGVNEDQFDPARSRVLSTSICDACALAPIFRVLVDCFGIEYAFLTTLHPWLGYQNLVGGLVRSRSQPGAFFPDFALGRASAGCLIPKSTTAGMAVTDLVEGLRGRITSLSYRVPTAAVCYGNIAAVLRRDTTAPEVLASLRRELSGVVRFYDEPLVSTDLIGEAASAAIDVRWVSVEAGRFLGLSAGYDNEWGYCSRIADVIDRLVPADATPPPPP